MPYRVLKFGGSSLGDAERVAGVVERVREARRRGPVALVVSALGSSTDHLVDALEAAARGDRSTARWALSRFAALAHAVPLDPAVRRIVDDRVASVDAQLEGVALLGEASPRVRDRVLAVGEAVSSLVVASALSRAGLPATPVDARAWLVTDDRHGDATVDAEASQGRLDALRRGWNGHVPVVTGFIAQGRDGSTTTLGRNGSDYTATLLAAGLGAEEVQIWTDVEGVMTADPRRVPEARPLAHLSYDEALELSLFGARVLHPRTMVPLLSTGIPLRIRSTLAPEAPGTRVDPRGADDEARATSVTSLDDQALVDVQFLAAASAGALTARVQEAVRSATEDVRLSTHAAHGQALSFVVPASRAERVRRAVEDALAPERARGELRAVGVRAPVALVTLVAEAMGRTPNVAGTFLGALGEAGVQVRALGQSASARSISVVVDQADVTRAVRRAHAAFHLSHERVSVLVLGKGTVGAAFVRALRDAGPRLLARHAVSPRLVGWADRRRVLFDEEGLAVSAPSALARAPRREGPWGAVDAALLDALAACPVPVLVDATADPALGALYEAAWARGIHVVTANKQPLAAGGGAWARHQHAARRAQRAFRYETTVGAALPVIETLQHLLGTGDVVHRIDGVLSGTLALLCDRVSAGEGLVDALRAARDAGCTEPRLQDDLEGLDVARKALILARELGLDVALEDVVVRPLLDLEGLDSLDGEALLEALGPRAEALERQVAAWGAEGRVLRHLAEIVPSDPPRLEVGPVAVGPDHAAYGLRGPTAQVAFTTDRYPEHPLVVQGAGAGAAVTASGLLADVVRIATGLRGARASPSAPGVPPTVADTA